MVKVEIKVKTMFKVKVKIKVKVNTMFKVKVKTMFKVCVDYVQGLISSRVPEADVIVPKYRGLFINGGLYRDSMVYIKDKVKTRVINGTGQCNFLRQRDRSSFIVSGQRGNGKS